MDIYQKLYGNLLFPFFETHVKKRATADLYRESLRTERLPGPTLRGMQLDALKALLEHAAENCTYYRKLFAENGFQPSSLSSIEELGKIPILTKEIIRENYHDLVSKRHRDRIWRKSTGGSTGEPLHFGYTRKSYEWRTAMSKRGYGWAGGGPGAKQAYIWGSSLGKVGHLRQMKERLHHLVDRQLYFNCFNFDADAMADCLAALNRFKPHVVVGYTNPLYNLALVIGRNSRISFRPRGVICAAEKVHPYQREVLERVFGAKVFNTYGSREFMLIAAECEEHNGLHVSAENLVVEILKDDGSPAAEGETGRIVITDLHNYGMPFIRYEIGDLGIATSRGCPCGRGLPLIADVVGRSLDVIRTAEGKILPGEFFPHLFKEFPEISRFQVVQEKIDHLVVKVVPSAPASSIASDSKLLMQRLISEAVGPTMRVEFEAVPEIPLTQTGKYRVTISRIGGEAND